MLPAHTHQDETLPIALLALRRLGLRQSAMLKAVGASIAHAPSFDECAASIERARIELENLEWSAERYRELGGGELLEACASPLAHCHAPSSWLEAVLAQLILCLASPFERRGGGFVDATSSWARHTAEDAEHRAAAQAALLELAGGTTFDLSGVSPSVARWVGVALETLDPSLWQLYLRQLGAELARLGVTLDSKSRAA